MIIPRSMHVAANDSILSFFVAFSSTFFSCICVRSLSCNLRAVARSLSCNLLNSTWGCLVSIFTMSTLGSVSIKGKRFQERSVLLRETCKENAQSGALWVPFHSCSHTQGHAHSMSPLSLRRLRHTEKHKHRHKMDTRRHTHTDTHADTQTLTLIHNLF